MPPKRTQPISCFSAANRRVFEDRLRACTVTYRQGLRGSLDLVEMKAEIHPEYKLANVHCSCGNQFYTRSTKDDLHVELCSECHPFYTGKQKLVDTGGRLGRFPRRAAKHRAGK